MLRITHPEEARLSKNTEAQVKFTTRSSRL